MDILVRRVTLGRRQQAIDHAAIWRAGHCKRASVALERFTVPSIKQERGGAKRR